VLLRRLLYVALFAIFLLHNDLWWWNDARRVFGMPIGLTYHIGLCLAAALILAVLARQIWPPEKDVEAEDRPPR
jgi:hypothetical protein